MGRSSCSRLLITPFLLTAVLAIDKYIQDADRFPGWKGELPKSSQPGVEANVDEHSKVLPILQMQSRAGAVTHSSICFSHHTDQLLHLQDHWTGEVIELSWQPRAFLFKSFMTEAECDHLIEKASCYIMLCHQLSGCQKPEHCISAEAAHKILFQRIAGQAVYDKVKRGGQPDWQEHG